MSVGISIEVRWKMPYCPVALYEISREKVSQGVIRGENLPLEPMCEKSLLLARKLRTHLGRDFILSTHASKETANSEIYK